MIYEAYVACQMGKFSVQNGQANDYKIICKDGEFGIHEHCLFNSEFLYRQHQARKNFEDEGTDA